MGCERWYLAAAGLLKVNEIPQEWGLLQVRQGRVEVVVRPQSGSQRKHLGIMSEMALLLASLRRVEVRIEPQTITEFLKWKNRMAAYNGGRLPQGLVPVEQELATTLQAPRAT
ncbi:MAG: hypothetical protein JO266_00860 [Acidobacteria bacterium]|nr:hypothetical protein [Acidobacteriota bacterium]